tara:strand:- start:639 stop:869 length:231 start_codon:yes stop_codon:yes gene_type:complete
MVRGFLIGLLLVSFMVGAKTVTDEVKKEVGRYKIEVTTYTSKKGSVFVLETVFDTKTGKVVERKRYYHTKYGKKRR